MWSRPAGLSPTLLPTDNLLPVRGSDHPAFLEMLFLWGAKSDVDQNYRSVVLPHGFRSSRVSDEQWEVLDITNFARALVSVPGGRGQPSIVPLKRFLYNSHAVDRFFVGTVSDWASVVYRTQKMTTQEAALAGAKKWLDDNKPKWDSYVSAINFERRP